MENEYTQEEADETQNFIIDIMERSSLPKNEETVKLICEFLMENEDMSPDDIIEHFRKMK